MLPVVLTLHVLASTAAPSWRQLAPGLELGRIPPRRHSRDAGEFELVRAEPRLVRAELATVAQSGGERHSAGAWVDQIARPGDVVVVTNAGMFVTDHRGHTGYLEAPSRPQRLPGGPRRGPHAELERVPVGVRLRTQARR